MGWRLKKERETALARRILARITLPTLEVHQISHFFSDQQRRLNKMILLCRKREKYQVYKGFYRATLG
jgi:hypothetical protein